MFADPGGTDVSLRALRPHDGIRRHQRFRHISGRKRPDVRSARRLLTDTGANFANLPRGHVAAPGSVAACRRYRRLEFCFMECVGAAVLVQYMCDGGPSLRSRSVGTASTVPPRTRWAVMPSTVLRETAKPCRRRKDPSLAWLGLAPPRMIKGQGLDHFEHQATAARRIVALLSRDFPAIRNATLLAGADKMARRAKDRYRFPPVISDSSLKPEPRRIRSLQSVGVNSFRLPSGSRRRFSDHYVTRSSRCSPDEFPDLRFTRTAVAVWDGGSQMKAFQPTRPDPRHGLLVLQ